MSTAIIILLATTAAGLVSGAVSLFVVRRAILPDLPNQRSSHAAATPRAGGFAIFGGFAVAALIFFLHAGMTGGSLEFVPVAALGLAAFAFGAIDDLRPLGARIKLGAQIAIACTFTATYGAVQHIPAPFIGVLDLGATAFPLTVFWIVAFMNAYNFMDGINGIAGACGLFVLSALGVAAAYAGNPAGAPAVFLAAALFGFLPLNFPDGRLFMGDGGSQFAGFMIAALAVLSGDGYESLSRLFTPIAFLPFIVDVTFTLIHRARRGRNVFEAHNEHVYQLMVRLGRSHQAVTTIYLTLVVFSSAVAMAVNGLAPAYQYAAALALAACYCALGADVFRRAKAAGLLTGAAAARDGEAEQDPVPAAAE